MTTRVIDLTENEREWYDYFMQSYSKDQIVVKYILKLKLIARLEGHYDGVLYD